MSTLRIGHLSDSHFNDRHLDEVVRVHAAFLEQAKEANVDLILHGGDFFQRKSSPAERNELASFLMAAAEIAALVGVRGNHDVEGDLDIFNCFMRGTILDRPTVAPGSALAWRLDRTSVATLALPWFSKAHLAAGLPPDLSADETTARTIEAARSLLTCIRAEAERCRREGMTPVLVAHVQVAGAETSTGQTLIGQTVELAPGDLADLGCEYVALGHIHKAQGWHGGRVAYSGSPWRHDFGEPEAKGWNLVTIENGKLLSVAFQELPARRIVLFEVEYDAQGHAIGDSGTDRVRAGDLVRIRAKVPAEALHLVTDEALVAYFDAGAAIETKVEMVVIHQARVRSEEIVQAADTKQKILAYWAAAGIEVPDAAKERIFAKLEEIETRQRSEAGEVAA